MKNINHFAILILVSITLLNTGCPIAPSSRLYKTMSWETPLYQNSTRCIFPNDLKIDEKKHLNSQKIINWVGVIKNVETKLKSDTGFIKITLEQKYWDYIEDFSIQDEKMFVSPHGEGEFYYTKNRIGMTQETLDTLSMNININDLGICYGQFIGFDDDRKPQLAGHGIRFVPYKYYSTKIMSYKAEKDSLTGETICDNGNIYKLIDFKFLKIAGPGQNKN